METSLPTSWDPRSTSLSCHNKIPQPGWPKYQKFVSQSLKLGRPKLSACWFWCPLFLACLLCPHMAGEGSLGHVSLRCSTGSPVVHTGWVAACGLQASQDSMHPLRWVLLWDHQESPSLSLLTRTPRHRGGSTLMTHLNLIICQRSSSGLQCMKFGVIQTRSP